MIRLLVLLLLAAPAWAENGSLFSPAMAGGPSGASLFPGAQGTGILARAPVRPDPVRPSDATARLLDLIATVEAGPLGYDAVQHGARIPPPRRPTQMTLAEIEDWIAATPGQPHAIGRYQIIPGTLRHLIDRMDLPPTARFSPALQDRMGEQLMVEAGYRRFQAGTLGRTRFMNNLARVWAGLPNSAGRSHYDGYAGNRAGMTWGAFQSGMAQIFPDASG